MLKIKDNVDLKELEKYGIFPEYTCNTATGEVRIKGYSTREYKFSGLFFKKQKRLITKPIFYDFDKWFLVLVEENFRITDIDLLYDLIKDGLVEKVDN